MFDYLYKTDTIKMSYQYVYLIQTREFVNSKQPVYKIGKTKQINYSRFIQYPKGSVQIFQTSCYNCNVLEKNVIRRFEAKYQNCKSIGKEYFKGNARQMVNDICQLLLLEQEEPTESFAHEIVTDISNDSIRNVCNEVPKDIGVEPTISETSIIRVEATEVPVELEPQDIQDLLVELEPIKNLVIQAPEHLQSLAA